MTSVRRRALAAAALTVTAGLTLSACGTSFGAQTNKVYQPAVGANARGEVDVLNTLLVANPDGSATVSAGVVNNADTEQTLSSVEVTTLDDETLKVEDVTKTQLPLKPGVFNLVGSSTDAGGFRVDDAEPGLYVKVTFTFSDSSPVTIEAPVVARTAEYDNITGSGDTSKAELEKKAEQDAAGAETESGKTGDADAR